MKEFWGYVIAFLGCFSPTLWFLGLKFMPHIFTRGGYPYNWEASANDTISFMIVLSINMLAYTIYLIFYSHWYYGWPDRG